MRLNQSLNGIFNMHLDVIRMNPVLLLRVVRSTLHCYDDEEDGRFLIWIRFCHRRCQEGHLRRHLRHLQPHCHHHHL